MSRPPWKSAIAEGVSVNKYSFNNNNKKTQHFPSSLYIVDEIGNKSCLNKKNKTELTFLRKDLRS